MNWMEFVASLINSLVWPVTIIMVIVLLRGPISARIKDLISLKYKDIEIVFNSMLGETSPQLETEMEQLEDPNLKYHFDQLEKVAELSPYDGVQEAWIIIVNLLESVADQKGLALHDTSEKRGLLLTVKLRELNVIDNVIEDNLIGLWNARSLMLRKGAISPKTSLSYISIARLTANKLQAIKEASI